MNRKIGRFLIIGSWKFFRRVRIDDRLLITQPMETLTLRLLLMTCTKEKSSVASLKEFISKLLPLLIIL